MGNKKQQFLETYDMCLKENGEVKKLVVAVKLPTGATEIIINTENISSKVDYYTFAYNTDMKLNTNDLISIVGWMFV